MANFTESPYSSKRNIGAVIDGLKLGYRLIVKRHTIVPKPSQLPAILSAVTDQLVEVPATNEVQIRNDRSQPYDEAHGPDYRPNTEKNTPLPAH